MRVSRQFYFLNEKISHAQKSTKSIKRKQATFTQMFFMLIKNIKSTKKHKTSNKQFSSS